MAEWTNAAQSELERYFDRMRPAVATSGADPDEVVDDVRRRIHEEVAARQLHVVTIDDVKHLLVELGPPDVVEPAGGRSEQAAPCEVEPLPHLGWWRFTLIAVFGVALPLATIVVELTTSMCASVFFDPLPTPFHAAATFGVPIANALALAVLTGALRSPFDRLALWACGFSVGIAGFYSLLFLPLLPLSVVALVIGLGVLPLAPYFALSMGLYARGLLRVYYGTRGFGPGAAVALALFVLLHTPTTVTELLLQRAAFTDGTERSSALRWLRRVGDEEVLLRRCYTRATFATDLFGFFLNSLDSVSPDEARNIYYEVTGRPFNAVPPPRLGRRGHELENTFDADAGGEQVGGNVRGLSLYASRLDGSVDPDAALAYVEWTLEFKNDSVRAQEARSQVLLPPGAVVSRLTLWVDGEEREAAFAGRGDTRAAYQNIVRQQRDPVLVTTAGPDRVLVQCFPVPANGGRMKIRVGVTAPLLLDKLDAAELVLPHIVERNFHVPATFQHAVWVESKQRLTVTSVAKHALAEERTRAGAHALRGAFGEGAPDAPAVSLVASRSPAVARSWAPDARSESPGDVIVQSLDRETIPAVSRVVLVVDSSADMATVSPSLHAAFDALPKRVPFALVIAGHDDAENGRTPELAPLTPAKLAELKGVVEDISFEGGIDNVPALLRAWDLAALSDAAIVWVHGPQPVSLTSPAGLEQRWERRSDGPRLYAVSAVTGPNRILEAFDGVDAAVSVPRRGALQDDLARLFKTFQRGASRVQPQRNRLEANEAPETTNGAHRTSDHLVRLWALGTVRELLRDRNRPEQRELATALASRHALVTPVTGAVVLETQAQFQQAGLEPVAAGEVPTIPEPETWALLFMVLLFAIGVWIATRLRAQAATGAP